MHSDITLAILDEETTILGRLLRTFKADICAQFSTKELKREAQARQRLKAGKDDQGGQSSSSQRKPRSFNLNTYKIHALGDYVETIKTYGTTDSYSTEPVNDALALIEYYIFLTYHRVNWSIAVPRRGTSAPPKRNSSNNLRRLNEGRLAYGGSVENLVPGNKVHQNYEDFDMSIRLFTIILGLVRTNRCI
jgi:hypothetical protein